MNVVYQREEGRQIKCGRVNVIPKFETSSATVSFSEIFELHGRRRSTSTSASASREMILRSVVTPAGWPAGLQPLLLTWWLLSRGGGALRSGEVVVVGGGSVEVAGNLGERGGGCLVAWLGGVGWGWRASTATPARWGCRSCSPGWTGPCCSRASWSPAQESC